MLRARSSAVRASALQAEGPRFESGLAHQPGRLPSRAAWLFSRNLHWRFDEVLSRLRIQPYASGMGETRRTHRVSLADRALQVALVLVLLAPLMLMLWGGQRQPQAARSAADLDELSADELLIVTRNFTDADMPALDRFTGLQTLHLHYSDVTDAGMQHVAQHKSLREFVLWSVEVSDAGMANLAGMAELRQLSLMGCVRVTSNGLRVVRDMPQLESLWLLRCPLIDDEFCGHLAGLQRLQELGIHGAPHLTDEALRAIAGLPALRKLDLSMCSQVTDDGIALLAAMPALEDLRLPGCDGLTDACLTHIARMKGLKYLHLPRKSDVTNEGVVRLRTELAGCEIIQE